MTFDTQLTSKLDKMVVAELGEPQKILIFSSGLVAGLFFASIYLGQFYAAQLFAVPNI